MRDNLPNYGAVAGAIGAAYLIASKRYPNWHPVSKFAESMTVGYLGGFLLAPLIYKKCSPEEIALEKEGPDMLGYGSAISWQQAATLGGLPEGCAKYQPICGGPVEFNTITGEPCPPDPQSFMVLCAAKAPSAASPRTHPRSDRPKLDLQRRPSTPAPSNLSIPPWGWALGGAALAVVLLK